MSQFKNARISSLHFSADGEGTSTALPSRNIPGFYIASPLLLTTVSYMKSNQRNVMVCVILIVLNRFIEDTANLLNAAENIIPMTKPQTITNHGNFNISSSSCYT
ncbi:hypothetical protein ACJMK2_027933 [Sinanodonta woodiana]|uniref:Uncharacterized protein n=1 Tax=Sinanodonta woodiana TaxID=1069815 RepID=A0ABD3X7C0_SINWO